MRRKVDLLLLITVTAIGIVGVLHARQIGDWWHARTYQPSDEIVQLAEDAGMSDTGKKYFYRFEPTLVDQATLDNKCNVEKLGCTEGRFIYILEPTTEAERNRAVVTAAHEMLHVAYSRLSAQKQNDLASLFDTELAEPAAADIVEELKGYSAADHDNEAHSFIGSELPGISTDLEEYYAQYFTNRTKTTDAYAASPER